MTDKNPKPTHTEKDQHLRSQLEKAIEEDSKPLEALPAPENPTPEEKLLLEVPCNLPEHLTLRRSPGRVNLPAACDSTTSPSGSAEKPLAKGPETPPSEEEDSSAVTSTQPTAVEEKRQQGVDSSDSSEAPESSATTDHAD
ncbi:hypothetical protein QAD02_014264 [Eretmocerus hayati]|uniref:Uncharacterized protein n=1 Tax=Eretmocerus hayati TaxID=131215 RepID=A0ACC2P7N3_9HYME|nr:hypothetical protein QAD02_014264 [Eretmocerus hayati]